VVVAALLLPTKELIAFGAGSWQENEAGSFLKRAGSHLENMSVVLEWADGSISSANLGQHPSDANQVRYLSQKFVERLCADDHIGSELVREIEAVIFSYIDPTDTLNASSFDELRAIRTEGIRQEGERLREDVMRLIREECDLRDVAAKLPEKKARIKTLTDERDGLSKQLPQAASPEEARIQKDLQEKRGALAFAQQAAAADKQKLQKVSDIRARIGAFKAQIARFYAEIEAQLKQAELPEVDWPNFRLGFSADTEAPLFGARRIAELLPVDLGSSVGAGDTDMDCFLSGVGLAVLVGELPINFQGTIATLRLRTSLEFGEAMFDLAALLQEGTNGAPDHHNAHSRDSAEAGSRCLWVQASPHQTRTRWTQQCGVFN
jgi:hypothetical protein